MALVGEAHIIVRAITDRVDRDIQKGFSGVSGTGRRAGESMGEAFQRGFNRRMDLNIFSRLTSALRSAVPGAEQARKAFQRLLGTGYALQTIIATIIPAIFALIGGIGALGGAAGGAIASLAALGGTLFALGAAMATARLALGGVGKAIAALNRGGGGGGGGGGAGAAQARAAAAKAVQQAEQQLALTIERNREALIDANNAVRDAQLGLNAALKQGREEIQQLGFDAEDAALAEERASLSLDDARRALAKAQDLPPNSRARREAELAYQEAELNYRQAKDRANDLAEEQDRLAQTGVKGTQVVIDATEALADAEANKAKTVRDALRSEADAQDALADAKENAANAGNTGGGGGGGGADPFAGLNQAQINFAKFIASLKPKFDELKLIAANSFLPPLQQAIELLMGTTFDTVARGIGIVGAGLGQAAINLVAFSTAGNGIARLNSLFEQSGPLLATMGETAGRLVNILGTISAAAMPQAQRFFDFLNTSFGEFQTWLDGLEANGELTAFFQTAGDMLAQFGRIFGNIFRAIGGIIEANFGPGTGGALLLDWIEEVTQGWDDLNSTVEGKNALRQYFLDTATNAKAVLQAVGAFFKVFSDQAANPNIAKAFDILRASAPALGQIVQASVNAAPAFATLVAHLTEFLAKMADTGAIEIFFNTLTGIIDFIAGIFESELGGKILEIHGRIVAFTAAFGIFGQLAGFALKVVVGGLINLFAPIGAVITFVGALRTSFALTTLTAAGFNQGLVTMTYSSNPLVAALGRVALGVKAVGQAMGRVLLGPIGIVLGIIALLVGSFIYLYKTNEDFARQMDAVWAQLSAVFSQAGGQITAAILPLVPLLVDTFSNIVTSLVPVITLLAQAFGQIITSLAPLIPILLSALIPAFTQIITAVVPLIAQIIGALVPAFVAILDAVLPLVTTLIEALLPVFVQIIEAIAPLIPQLIDALMPAFMAILEAVMPLITALADLLVPVIQFLAQVLGFLIPIIVAVVQVIVDVLIAVITFLVDTITAFATDWEGTWDNIWGVINDVITNINNFVRGIWLGIFNFFAGIVNNIYNAIATAFGNIYNFINSALTNAKNVVVSIWNSIGSAIRNVVNGIIGTVEGMVNGIIRGFNTAARAINGLLGGIKQVTGINISIPTLSTISLPRLAEGGTVFPTTGGSIVNVAEAGRPERIEPLDENGLSQRDKAMIELLSGGGGGVKIYVTQLPNEDGEELAERISRILAFRNRRGATT